MFEPISLRKKHGLIHLRVYANSLGRSLGKPWDCHARELSPRANLVFRVGCSVVSSSHSHIIRGACWRLLPSHSWSLSVVTWRIPTLRLYSYFSRATELTSERHGV